ncbi:MAG TPA: hypothetical protein VNA15_03120 [Candidatus Angelobacter sp.]|nr:hypothetical protein [Candidatus Angelobacter sp.]
MKLETTVSDEVNVTARLLIDDAERANESASTLNRDDFSEKVEARDMEDARLL